LIDRERLISLWHGWNLSRTVLEVINPPPDGDNASVNDMLLLQ
jgi:hypothetical protein